MDGTIYLGSTLFDFTVPFLSTLKALGLEFSFVTNNNARSASQYVQHLAKMGINADLGNIYTSAHATIEYLRKNLQSVRRLLVVGTDGLCDDLQQGGFELVTDHPDAVIVGYDTTINYDKLSRAAYWITRKVSYIATHPDKVCPTDQPTILPDCGAICALLETSTGRVPDSVPGKPSSIMLQGLMRKHGVQAEQLAMVGDRLYTDMKMAHTTGAMAILTLTGETSAAMAARASQQPDLIIENLDELSRILEQVHGSEPTA